MTWDNTFFGECAELIKDTVQPSDVLGLPYIGLEHISQGQLSLLGFGKSDDVISAKSRFRKGDILFGKLRPYFRKVIIAPFDGVCSTDIWVVRAKQNIDQKFLFYWMASEDFVETSSRASEGTKMPRAQWEFVERIQQQIPSTPEQRAIAGILGGLDDKIELNRHMNVTLESMARAVFRQWFVENEDVGSWDIGQIKNLGEIITGKTPPTNDRENYDGEILFITIPDMHGKMFVIETGKTLSEQGVQTQRNKTLPPFSICVSCIATPGLVSMTTMPAQTNQQINSLIPRDNKSYFYCYFALRELGDEIRARGSGGSVLLNLNKGQFETMDISIPPADLMHKFQEFAEPLLMRLLANEKESRTLASLRDGLLPKLMRGEVRVKEVEENK